jgi:GNAT superfamily N-acetyltransferase
MEITKKQLQENYNQSDVDFVFDSNPKLSEIGTKEEYSQYLDTIFPSSKIREIFFHRSRSEEKFNSFDLEKVRGYGDYGGNGFYFAPLEKIKNLWKKPALSNVTNNIVSVLLDIKNPWRDPQDRKQYDTKEWNEYINTEYNGMNNMFNPWYDDKDFKNKFDAIFDYNDYNNYERLVTSIPTQVLVYRPNQIHILGSKQDIERFKNFVNNTDMEVTKGELEEAKKKKADRCLRIARKRIRKSSAYRSGNIVRCRQGEIWQDLKEEEEKEEEEYSMLGVEQLEKKLLDKYKGLKTLFLFNNKGVLSVDMIEVNPNERNKGIGSNVINDIIKYADANNMEIRLNPAVKDERKGTTSRNRLVRFYKSFGFIENTGRNIDYTKKSGSMYRFPKSTQKLNEKTDYSKEKKQGLHGWFARQGGSGKSKGWVDCNTCRDGKCKSCGRQKGESRSKYPACRPTPSACKTRGKGKSWGKKSAN